MPRFAWAGLKKEVVAGADPHENLRIMFCYHLEVLNKNRVCLYRIMHTYCALGGDLVEDVLQTGEYDCISFWCFEIGCLAVRGEFDVITTVSDNFSFDWLRKGFTCVDCHSGNFGDEDCGAQMWIAVPSEAISDRKVNGLRNSFRASVCCR